MLKSNVKKIMLGVCATAFALLTVAGVNKTLPEKVSANTVNTSEHVQMVAGGQIRKKDPMGLGFVTTVDKDYYDALSGTKSTGTIIATKDALDKAGLNSADKFTVEGVETYNAANDVDVKMANVANQGWITEMTGVNTTDNYVFRGSVVALTAENSERTYCARGYVCVDGVYTYTEYVEADNARSVQRIAYEANESGAFASETEVQTYIEQFLPAKAYDETVPTLFRAGTVGNEYIVNTSSIATDEAEAETLDAGAITALNFGGGYTGTAMKIANPVNNGNYHVKVPQVYKETLMADYAKIGMWFAYEKKADATHTNAVDLLGNTLVGSKNYTDDDFNTWFYVEKDISVLDSIWKEGKINLLQVWSNNTATFKSSFNFYIGDITLISQADLELAKKGILDGVTSENSAQYQFGTAAKGEFVAANTYDLNGGYTGGAVEFALNAGSPYSVELPKSCLPADKTGKYFSMWFALRTKEAGATISGNAWLMFQTPVTNKLFSNTFTYASGGVSTSNVTFSAAATAYKADTWYQLMVPLASVTDEMYLTESSYLSLFQITSGSGFVNADYNMLIGNIGIVDVTTPEGYMLKVNAIEGSNLKGNNNNNKGTYVSAEDVAALGFTNDNGYSGAALAFTGINNAYYATLSQADYEKYTNAANGYTKIRIWYAASTVGTVSFIKEKTTALMNIASNQDATKGAWTYLEFNISALNATTYVDGKVYLFNVWCTAESGTSPTLYVGDIQFLK